MIPAAQCPQKLVPGKHAQNVHQPRRRTQQAAAIRVDHCHAFLPTVMNMSSGRVVWSNLGENLLALWEAQEAACASACKVK